MNENKDDICFDRSLHFPINLQKSLLKFIFFISFDNLKFITVVHCSHFHICCSFIYFIVTHVTQVTNIGKVMRVTPAIEYRKMKIIKNYEKSYFFFIPIWELWLLLKF